MQIGTALAELAAADPQSPMLTFRDQQLTRADVNAAANRWARAYADLGVMHSDRVAVALPNGVDFYVTCHALWKLGAIPVPISPRLAAPEQRELLALVDPKLVVGASAHRPDVKSLPAGWTPDASIADDDLPAPEPGEIWKIAATGGSTGLPKLIVPAQGTDVRVAALDSLRMRATQKHLVVGPLYHASPFNWSVLGSLLGQHLVVLERFDAEVALRAISDQRVNWVCLVPTMMHRMARLVDADPHAYDLSSLEVVWHMAAPCPQWLKRRWIDLVGPDTLMELYGTTEGLALTAITGREWLEHPGSVGRPIQGEVAVFDDRGVQTAPGDVGDVYMRSTAPRTYRYIGATTTTLPGGWQGHGDRGYLDAEGFLYLADRATDMILVGGANVYPAEIEAAILEFPGVMSCAVVGLPDADLGQRVHAVVQADRTIDEADLLVFLNERLSRTKVPRSFRFVDEDLRDDAGKVRRTSIRDREIAAGNVGARE